MLIVRPRPAPTESMMGFMLRLSECNGYPSTAFLQSYIRRDSTHNHIGRLDAQPLVKLAGITQQDAARLSLRPVERPRAYIRLFGQDMPSYEVSLANPKVCPQCLAEHRRCEAFWDLTQARACPVHKTMLLKQCPRCGDKLRWSRRKVSECPCGANLAACSSPSAQPALCELMALLRYQVYRDHMEIKCPPSLHHMAHLSLRQLCKLTWVMTSMLHCLGEKKKRHAKSRLLYEVEAERVAKALLDWPNGFQAFLNELYENTLLTAEILPRYFRTFDWVFARMIKNSADKGSAYQFIATQVSDFGTRYWTRGAMARAGSKALPPLDAYRWGTVSEAAEILGLHMVTMSKLIDAGEIPVRRISSSGVRPYIVDLEWARKQRVTKEPSISVREAAKEVGISIDTLRSMISKRIYTAAHRPTFPGSLTREDVREFAGRLRRLVKGKKPVRTEGVTTVDKLFFEACASPDMKAEVFAHLVANPHLVVGKAAGVGVGSAQVRSRDLRPVLEKLSPDVRCIRMVEAGAGLNCVMTVVAALKRAGYLETVRVKGRERIVEASFRGFSEKYMSVSSVARRLGMSANAAYSRLDLEKIKHIKAGATVFVRKSCIAKVEAMLRS